MKTAYDGKCSFAVSVGKTNQEAKEKYSIVKGDTKYLFSNSIAKFLWKILPNREKKANENWNRK